MKIAVSGKGGVGKTTIVAWLCEYLASKGKNVWLVDADTALSLGQACGLDLDKIPQALIKNEEVIADKISPSEYGMMVLNPKVDDLPEALSCKLPAHSLFSSNTSYGEKRLLVMGGISEAGGGCACESNALLKALLAHLILERDDVVIVDMEAGVEHLGRGTVRNVEHLLVISEPSMRALQTANEVSRMAKDLGLEKQTLILNKANSEQLENIPNLEHLPSSRKNIPYLQSLANQQLLSPCVLGLDEADAKILEEFMQDLVKSMTS